MPCYEFSKWPSYGTCILYDTVFCEYPKQILIIIENLSSRVQIYTFTKMIITIIGMLYQQHEHHVLRAVPEKIWWPLMVFLYLSRVMTEPAFCICETKAQISCAIKHACSFFHYIDSTITLLKPE